MVATTLQLVPGETGGTAPAFIKTVASRGYRFIAAVDAGEPSSLPAVERLSMAGGDVEDEQIRLPVAEPI
jgi:hypothetical protein